MKIFFILALAASCGVAWAQTNAPVKTGGEQQTEVTSKIWQFDGNTRQGIYLGNVVVTDQKGVLHCGQLIVDLPPDGSHPTNIVAITNVVIDALDEKGQTNHITADKAVYTYSVVNSVTNETIVFTGGDPMPKVETPQFTGLGDPLTFDLITKKYSASNFKTIFKQPPGLGNGTNTSPFNFLK